MSLPSHHPATEIRDRPESLTKIGACDLSAVAKEVDPKGKPPGRTPLTREDLILLAGWLHALFALAWYALAVSLFVAAIQLAGTRKTKAEVGWQLPTIGEFDDFLLREAMMAFIMMVITLAFMALNAILAFGLFRLRSSARWIAGVQSLAYAIVSLFLPSIDPGDFGVAPHETIWTRLLAGGFGLMALLLLSPGSSYLFSIGHRAPSLGNAPRDPEGLL